MRFESQSKRSSSRVALVTSLALFVVLCGAILFAVSLRIEPLGLAEGTDPGVDSATRRAIERALQHIDDADRALDEGNRESGKSDLRQAREALYEIVPAPFTTNRGGET